MTVLMNHILNHNYQNQKQQEEIQQEKAEILRLWITSKSVRLDKKYTDEVMKK